MVVKMMKWSPWPPATAKMFQVKVKEMELLDFFNDEEDGDGGDKVMAVEMRWKEKEARKTGLVPFHRLQSSKRRKHISREIVLRKGEAIKWQDEFVKVFSSPIASKDADEFGPSEVSIALLYGAKNKGKPKMAVVGKVALDLAELASKAEAVVETKVPITVNYAGVATEAALSVCFSFMEVRNSEDSGTVQNSTVSENGGVSSDESAVTDSEGTPDNELVVKTRRVELSSSSESESGLSSETQADSVKKAGLFSWKRRRLSFKPAKTKPEPSIKKTIDDDDHDSKIDVGLYHTPKPYATEASCEPGREQEESSATGHGHWEEKEVLSRDGESKLRASVFFAGFDQRSDKAAGESACTALVAVIAHWLQSNQDTMPTRSELDRLIVEGSSEWRKLCEEEALKQRFPDKHFDLETVVQAGLRPVSVSRDKSFIAFFAPEKFESLRGAMSFDQIWDQISSYGEGRRPPRTYIVSWNDHFFVLKVDADAYYIIDTLGERLFEGCNRAFMLRFDDSTVMHRRVKKEKPGPGPGSGSGSEEMLGAEPAEPEATSDQEEICRGKECCREFIKRFLAAIPLGELEEQETKEAVSYFALHQRLQIEFNYCSSSPSSSSSSWSTHSTSSLF